MAQPVQQSLAIAAGITPSLTDTLQILRPQGHLPSSPVYPPCQAGSFGTHVTSLTDAFFAFFHHSHPFLLPQARLRKLLERTNLPHLESAIRYIGSSYVPSAPTGLLEKSVDELLFHRNPPKDGFTVQAMLLFAIGLHANGERERSMEVMQTAVSIALDIGLHRRDFAPRNAAGCNVTEESWRRTWWELYVVDGMLAGVNRSTPSRLHDVASDVSLPCEESDFATGVSDTHHPGLIYFC